MKMRRSSPTILSAGKHDRPRLQTYRELYETAVQFLPPPDLVIYLRASVDTLMSRINSRGRDYERKIMPEYLQNLNDLYEGGSKTLPFAPCSPSLPMTWITWPITDICVLSSPRSMRN
jgi:deoxyadenosine/deoxycytidine kinase